MQITLGELLHRIEQAQARMSRRNPHRELFSYCHQVLMQMALTPQIGRRPTDISVALPPAMTPPAEAAEHLPPDRVDDAPPQA